MCSWSSTTSITTGRSPERSTRLAVWITLPAPKSRHAVKHGGACEALRRRRLEQRAMQRLVVPLVAVPMKIGPGAVRRRGFASRLLPLLAGQRRAAKRPSIPATKHATSVSPTLVRPAAHPRSRSRSVVS